MCATCSVYWALEFGSAEFVLMMTSVSSTVYVSLCCDISTAG